MNYKRRFNFLGTSVKIRPMIRVFLSFLSLYFILASSLTTAYALTINKIRVGVEPEKNRLVLELTENTQFQTFTLTNPNRLVIDLPSFDWQASTIQSNGKSLITAVRHGPFKPGISRIVLELEQTVDIQNAFILRKQSSIPDRLVIDMKPALQNGQQKKTYGTLDIKDPPPAKPFLTNSPTPRPSGKPAQEQKRATNTQKPLIIIDPGHGGVDPGAVGGKKLHEKNVVLKLAKELERQLLASGRYRVKLTRQSDIFIKLHKRVGLARKHDGDLFISIHADSIGKSDIQGASVYTLSEKASDAQTAKLAARENQADLIGGIDLTVEDEQVADILVDLAMRDTMNQSNFFANTLVSSLKASKIKTLPNTHRYAGFAVLKAPDIPSVLIEAGFMSNPQEAQKLNTSAYRKKISAAIKKGIDQYFTQVSKNERI